VPACQDALTQACVADALEEEEAAMAVYTDRARETRAIRFFAYYLPPKRRHGTDVVVI